jgi:hypothetical protein
MLTRPSQRMVLATRGRYVDEIASSEATTRMLAAKLAVNDHQMTIWSEVGSTRYDFPAASAKLWRLRRDFPESRRIVAASIGR